MHLKSCSALGTGYFTPAPLFTHTQMLVTVGAGAEAVSFPLFKANFGTVKLFGDAIAELSELYLKQKLLKLFIFILSFNNIF